MEPTFPRWLWLGLLAAILPACGRSDRESGAGSGGGAGGGGTNQAPSAMITSPSSGASFAEGSTIVIHAGASDPDGTIVKVDFFKDDALLATSTGAPFFFTWHGVPEGSHRLTVTATDNLGLAATSNPVTITVAGGGGPTVSSWSELAGSGSGAGLSGITHTWAPTVALDGAGNPNVVWQTRVDAGSEAVYFKRWDPVGNAWMELGGSASGGGVSGVQGANSGPSVAVDGAGNPVIAWTWVDGTDSGWTYVKRWNPQSSAWEGIAGSASGQGLGAGIQASLAIDQGGNILVVWEGSPGDIHLKKWNAASGVWEGLGGSAEDGGLSRTPESSLWPSVTADPAGNPVVAWGDGSGSPGRSVIYVRRWNPGTSRWDELGGSATGPGLSFDGPAVSSVLPSIAVGSDGNPVVSWIQGTDVYLRKWNPTSGTWMDLGGSGSGRGISDDSFEADGYRSWMALDPQGSPVVVWSDVISTTTDRGGRIQPENAEVRLKRWDAVSGAWIGMDGSEAPEGISRNAGLSYIPMLAVDGSGGITVVWQDSTSGNGQIYLRRRVRT